MEIEKGSATGASEEVKAAPEEKAEAAPETSGKTAGKKPGLSTKAVVIVAMVIVVTVVAAATVIVVQVLGGKEENSNAIGYAANAKVMLDQDALQAAMDEAMRNAREGNIGLRYKNNAYSDDGINFKCSITNSPANAYDMYLTIFADAEMSDQIFLSGLVPPGSGFDSITLDHALDPGQHRVYVAVTQVKTDENGDQVIHKQVIHTMDFFVSE